MSELWQPGALELAGRIGRGDVSSRAGSAAHLVRVDDEGPTAADAAVA